MSRPLANRLDPDLLLRAYAGGIFPMAERADSPDVFWVEPRRRGILPLDGFHLPRSLAKTLKQERFRFTVDRAFAAIVAGCAEPAPGRSETWINPLIAEAYVALHRRGHAHSVEAWTHDGELAGGLYGVRLGAAFFGESMFTHVRDASKCCLAALVARLRLGGFTLLDTQFLTHHLAGFGAIEIPAKDYRTLLAAAVPGSGDFFAADEGGRGAGPSGKRIVQLLSQTS
ncbi:leucyl/phenylalanyl-tRNA--protein transferase [Sandarakinorhabdus rubra]|uniref:leucyl/phenylalanyl-tRNA--protein transferase n=1 Tax=Sandarakinorhabdus rubra TaxID=2672568 RepID=UPI0013DC06CB|nr:leucyl/phenylalanyl-tRNA--protein transferase [Sandarakinorhabdus rubra]